MPDNALYLGDVATSLQSIGELYLGRQDLKGGLAFYEAAVDVRLQVTLLSPADERARQNLTRVERAVGTVRKQVAEKYPLDDFSGGWWRKPVSDAEAANAKRRAELNPDSKTCQDRVMAAVDEIVSPATTATIR